MAHDKSKYHPAHDDIIRPLLLLKYRYCCQLCGIHHLDIFHRTGNLIYLSVAHRNGDPRDNRISNLTILCPSCHLKFDRLQHDQTRIINKSSRGLHPVKKGISNAEKLQRKYLYKTVITRLISSPELNYFLQSLDDNVFL